MLLTLVDSETYDYSDPSHSVLLEKESDHVPLAGDLIKDGHSLSSFRVFRVEGRVFRSVPHRDQKESKFSQVYLLVSKVLEH